MSPPVEAVFCGVVVGSIDNLLRPRLVGKDTEMHDLLILFSTLGGIALFGFIGFVIGPIIAALFVTIWEIYGVVFKDVLPEVRSLLDEPASEETAGRQPPVEDTGLPEQQQNNDIQSSLPEEIPARGESGVLKE